MGMAKDRMIREWDQGWTFAPHDRFVCASCFDDDALKAFIKDHAEAKACSYCGRRSKKPIGAPINAVLELIGESLHSEWGNPDDEAIPYESAEGGYQFPVMDTWDLFDEIEMPVSNDGIRDEILNSFSEQMWVQKNFYSLRKDHALDHGWRQFVKVVKHRSRYVFALIRPKKSLVPSDIPEPSEMLRQIEKVIREVGLVSTVKAGTLWFRGRAHDPSQAPNTAAVLGTAPEKYATSANRMSPAGIPMFYGAEDEETALREVEAHHSTTYQAVTVGAFAVARDFEVVDLCDIPEVPSLFDADRRHLRFYIRFLRGFVADLIKPVALDERQHIEYVPTQIVTEYIRRVFRTESSRKVRGLLYRGAQNGRRCCVLFFKNRHCCDEAPDWQNDASKWLGLTGISRRDP